MDSAADAFTFGFAVTCGVALVVLLPAAGIVRLRQWWKGRRERG